MQRRLLIVVAHQAPSKHKHDEQPVPTSSEEEHVRDDA